MKYTHAVLLAAFSCVCLALGSGTHAFADEPRLFKAQQLCLADNDRLAIQTIIQSHYTFKDKALIEARGRSEGDDRTLWSFICTLRDNKCLGFNMTLSQLDKSKPLLFTDTLPLEGMKVAAVSGNVFTIQWETYQTLVVDIATKRVEYKRSNAVEEWRGVGSCN